MLASNTLSCIYDTFELVCGCHKTYATSPECPIERKYFYIPTCTSLTVPEWYQVRIEPFIRLKSFAFEEGKSVSSLFTLQYH